MKNPKNKKLFDTIINLQQKEKNLNLKLNRNTIVDKIIDQECIKCESVKPPHVEHCSDCGRCVCYMDHHCPWINNCVGILTHKPFLLFCAYTLCAVGLSLSAILPEFLAQLKDGWIEGELAWKDCLLGCSAVQSLCFGILIWTILVDQISEVSNRTQALDHVKFHSKKINRPRRRCWHNWRVICGSKTRLACLVPTPINGNFAFEDLYH